MVSRLDQVLGMPLNGEDGEEINLKDSGIPNPYLQYGPDAGGPTAHVTEDRSGVRKGEGRPKSGKKSSVSTSASSSVGNAYGNGVASNGGVAASMNRSASSSRPKSAAKKRDESIRMSDSMIGSTDDDLYGNAFNIESRKTSIRGSTLMPAEDTHYPTARGLIRK